MHALLLLLVKHDKNPNVCARVCKTVQECARVHGQSNILSEQSQCINGSRSEPKRGGLFVTQKHWALPNKYYHVENVKANVVKSYIAIQFIYYISKEDFTTFA